MRIGGVEILGRPPAEVRAARGQQRSRTSRRTRPPRSIRPHDRDAAARGDRGAPPRAQHHGETRDRVLETLARGQAPDRRRFLRRYPHQLSGGQQQRVCIAMAFLLRPQVIVLDEPTTGLDVTTQAHVLETVRELCARARRRRRLRQPRPRGRLASWRERVLVMYAGRIVEAGPVDAALHSAGPPVHAQADRGDPRHRGPTSLEAIPGHVPPPGAGPTAASSRLAAQSRFRAAAMPSRRSSPWSRVTPWRCFRVAEVASDGPRARRFVTDADGSGNRACARSSATSARSTATVRWCTTSRSSSAQASAWRSSASRAPARRRSRASIMGLHVPRSGDVGSQATC